MKPITLAESRAELVTRIPDPIERAYVLLRAVWRRSSSRTARRST
jgi:hypothetical protein